MLCKKCGAQIPDDAAKCEFCGEVFKETPETSMPEENVDMGDTRVIGDLGSEAEEQNSEENLSQRSTHEIFEENARKRKSQVEKVVDERQHQLDEINARRNQKKQRQKRNKIILIACVCVLVAAAAGLGTYYVKNGGFPIGNTVIATPNPTTSAIPTLAPVPTSAVNTVSPQPATEEPSTNSSSSEGTNASSSGTSSSGNGGSGGSASSSGTSSSGSGSGGSTSSSGTSSSGSSSGGSASSSGASSSGNGGSSGSASSSSNEIKYSGVVSSNITSKLGVGGEVIYDSPSDKYFMTFSIDGITYYANVSRGSTTEQIKDKYMTVTAQPTNGRYNGNTVYEITSLTYYDGDYIIPDSGTKLINRDDIADMNKDQLALARNEIYARHGRKFQMEVYQKYFESKSWYKVNPNYDYTDDNKNLNDIELKNVATILSVENSK